MLSHIIILYIVNSDFFNALETTRRAVFLKNRLYTYVTVQVCKTFIVNSVFLISAMSLCYCLKYNTYLKAFSYMLSSSFFKTRLMKTNIT